MEQETRLKRELETSEKMVKELELKKLTKVNSMRGVDRETQEAQAKSIRDLEKRLSELIDQLAIKDAQIEDL